MKKRLFIFLVIGVIACSSQEKSTTANVEHSFTLDGHDYTLSLSQDYQLVQNSKGITIDFAPGGSNPMMRRVRKGIDFYAPSPDHACAKMSGDSFKKLKNG